jgi:hypothetical protein
MPRAVVLQFSDARAKRRFADRTRAVAKRLRRYADELEEMADDFRQLASLCERPAGSAEGGDGDVARVAANARQQLLDMHLKLCAEGPRH